MLTDAKFRQSLFLKYGEPEQKRGQRITIRYRQNRDDLVCDIVDYFSKPVEGLHYPSKAYAVAIIYARLLESYFGHEFWQSLADPELFCGSAPFFLPYSHSKEVARVYNLALEELVRQKLFPRFPTELDQVSATVCAFEREYSVHLKSLAEVLEQFAPYLTLTQCRPQTSIWPSHGPQTARLSGPL